MKERIDFLSQKLHFLNAQYYQNSKSEVTDYQFDLLLKELQLLETQFPELKNPNSPTERVGGTITKNFKNVNHRYPMLSLSNTYSKDELFDWENKFIKLLPTSVLENHKISFFCEQKFDGVAISLIYENGQLKQAITRGDGQKGDDITANAKTISSIPLVIIGDNIPPYFEVRGEVYFPLANFEKLNKEQEELGEQLYANPRNTASGTLKLQDSAEVARRGLDCFMYYLLGENLPFISHEESMKQLEKWGFQVSNTYQKCESIEQVWNYIEIWETKRLNLPLATDGIVIKIDDFFIQSELGLTSKSPRWAIAFKFKAESVATILEKVTFQVGRTGAITPVANMKPVLLAGTTIKRATLHNEDEILRLDLHEGDTVFVEKGGEIIPKITSVDISKRVFNSPKILFIKKCLECGTELERKPEESAWFCPNEKGCPPQIKGRIAHFIHRKAMNIDGLGEETVDSLFEAGLIKTYADLYELSFNQLLSLERFAEKSAQNAIDGLKKSVEIPFEKVLFGLGIKFVGSTVADKLAKNFKNIENLQNASLEELVSTPEIGEKIALSVRAWFSDLENIHLIEKLKSFGLQFKIEEKEITNESEVLKGLTFVISGTFNTFSREELQDKIVANGGKILSGVSGKLNYLVAGENMGPSKLEKANKLGVKIISESEFLLLL
ncbi:MAG: NAD-dependent DNA ligase LigA [Cytophagales bacterium]|nr:MAG: NAD-dependent DNA ligase LigA [Cytophagales bacterium]